MAQVREYGYYIKANKIKLVERDINFDNDANSKSYGPGVDRGEWKSPLATVSDGLQLEYTYAPTYHILAGADINDATRAGSGTLGAEYPFFGYTSKGGYLAFVHCNKGAAFVDWSGSGYNEEFVVDDYILVSGSHRWSGLHTVKSRESDGGMIVTNTPFSAKYSYEGRVNIVASTLKITGDSTSDDEPAIDNIFGTDSSISQYMIATALEDGHNKQILKVTRTDEGELTVSTEIGFSQGKWDETDPATISDETDEDCTIYKVIEDNLIVYPNNAISVMEDESFELDLPEYLGRALEIYMRARIFDETGDLEKSVYYMKEFRKHMEKHDTSKQWGARMVASGPYAIK